MAERGPFKPGDEGSSPSSPTNPPLVQRQDTRPITGESGFESTGEDHYCYRCHTVGPGRVMTTKAGPIEAWACATRCDG